MATTLEVIRGISQAAANAYDGAHMESYSSDGKSRAIGLKREEGKIEQTIADIASFLKKEYKVVTGNSLSLSPVGEVDIIVQKTSRVRTWCQAKMYYDIGSVEGVEAIKAPSEDSMDVAYRKFLDQGGFQGKRPQNDTRKKE